MSRWKWMRLSDLRAALRWPWDHTNGGQHAARNDNGWVLITGKHWIHFCDLPRGKPLAVSLAALRATYEREARALAQRKATHGS